MSQYKTHTEFIDISKTLFDAEDFTKITKWGKLYPTFINYLGIISGCDRVSLSYSGSYHEQPNMLTMPNFL